MGNLEESASARGTGPEDPSSEAEAFRWLRLLPLDSDAALAPVYRLLRDRVEAEVAEALRRDFFVLDVEDTALRVFSRFVHGPPPPPEANLDALLGEAVGEAVRESLFPSPGDPDSGRAEPLVVDGTVFEGSTVRATQAAFNRLPREERRALFLVDVEGSGEETLLEGAGGEAVVARATLRRARRAFRAALRRVPSAASGRAGGRSRA